VHFYPWADALRRNSTYSLITALHFADIYIANLLKPTLFASSMSHANNSWFGNLTDNIGYRFTLWSCVFQKEITWFSDSNRSSSI